LPRRGKNAERCSRSHSGQCNSRGHHTQLGACDSRGHRTHLQSKTDRERGSQAALGRQAIPTQEDKEVDLLTHK